MTNRHHLSRWLSANAILLILAAVLPIGGCGRGEDTSFIKTRGDYVRNAAGRGMAKIWGVIVDIEGLEVDAAGKIENEGTIGESAETTNASVRLLIGDVRVQLKSTNRPERYDLMINERRFGRVKSGNRVLIDHDRIVEVNGKERKPQ